MKKFFALVLALVMALSLTTVAWGATNVASQSELTAAIANGDSEIVLAAGAYTLPTTTGNVTISGTTDAVVTINTPKADTITLKGVTVVGSGLYTGIQHSTKVVYEDCVIKGMQCLYATDVEFINCDFDSNGKEHCVWTYGAKNVTFTNCDFTYGDRCINVYTEAGLAKVDVKLEGCTFTTSNTASKGAVEINSSSYGEAAEVSLTGCTAPANGEMAYVSEWDSTGGEKTDIVVDGDLVGAVAEVNGTQYKSLQAAIAAAAGGTVKLLDDVTLTGSINVTDAVTIDGNNKTVTMTYTGTPGTGNAIFNANNGNEGIDDSLTVKNLKMVMTGATKQGYAVVAKKADSAFAISFTGCHFENMWCGVMLNGCGGTVAPTVTITDSSFKDVNYGLSFAEEAYAGDVSFENNTMTGEISIQETFPAGSGYLTTPTVEISSGSFTSDVTDYLAAGLFQNANGSVASLPTSVIPSGGATLAPKFEDRADAQYASWNAKVSVKKAENAKDKEFAIYTIEMIAKVDNAPVWWDSGVEEKGEDVDFTWNGEKTFVKVADEDYADFVVVDGKTITYFVAVDELEWDAKATKVTLPATPVDNADKACNTLYSGVEGVPATLYFYDDTLWVAATADDPNTTAVDESVWTDIFNVNGVAVLVREAEEGVDYEYTGHDYQLLTKSDHDTGAVTKVYCQDCKKEFKFVQDLETVAVATFGDDNYMPVVVDGRTVPMLFMEKVTPAIPGVSGAIGGNLISYGGSSTSTSTDKVQSAETFDAGIAMYVGMSVMAAAGSAVVIGKKKD